MSVIWLLGLILFILMLFVGGKQGLRAFISLFLNFVVIIVAIIFMLSPEVNAVIATFIACVAISCISLFYINGMNVKTLAAFLSTLTTVIILMLFIHFVTNKAMIQGFGEEETEAINVFSLYIGLDFIKIGAAVIIMSTIGAMMDVAISISTAMYEMKIQNPSLSREELFRSGLTIGRDILGTDTNTLFFAFFGTYLGLLIWFKDLSYSLGEIINSKVFSAEMITIFCAGIGIALVIPITAWISVSILMRTRFLNKQLDKS